jgi:hypothetical protein
MNDESCKGSAQGIILLMPACGLPLHQFWQFLTQRWSAMMGWRLHLGWDLCHLYLFQMQLEPQSEQVQILITQGNIWDAD